MPTRSHTVRPGIHPAPAPNEGVLPTSLTFFLSASERQQIVKKLKRLNSDRRLALLRALKLEPQGDSNHG